MKKTYILVILFAVIILGITAGTYLFVSNEKQKDKNNNVEIVSNEPKKTDYDNLMDEIAALNTKYQNDLQAILHKYQEKMNTFETEINDLKGKAEEHLKNAQAAETIATIAHQNAQNVTSNDNGIL